MELNFDNFIDILQNNEYIILNVYKKEDLLGNFTKFMLEKVGRNIKRKMTICNIEYTTFKKCLESLNVTFDIDIEYPQAVIINHQRLIKKIPSFCRSDHLTNIIESTI